MKVTLSKAKFAPMTDEEKAASLIHGGQEVLPEVLKDMQERSDFGTERYGTPLQINNGIDALQEAYEEALDLVVYLKQVLMERDADGI